MDIPSEPCTCLEGPKINCKAKASEHLCSCGYGWLDENDGSFDGSFDTLICRTTEKHRCVCGVSKCKIHLCM